MTERNGDPEKKKEAGCMQDEPGMFGYCRHLKTTFEDWESETKHCEVCGEHFTLYDDEMR